VLPFPVSVSTYYPSFLSDLCVLCFPPAFRSLQSSRKCEDGCLPLSGLCARNPRRSSRRRRCGQASRRNDRQKKEEKGAGKATEKKEHSVQGLQTDIDFPVLLFAISASPPLFSFSLFLSTRTCGLHAIIMFLQSTSVHTSYGQHIEAYAKKRQKGKYRTAIIIPSLPVDIRQERKRERQLIVSPLTRPNAQEATRHDVREGLYRIQYTCCRHNGERQGIQRVPSAGESDLGEIRVACRPRRAGAAVCLCEL
jgi:hypothetical protein